MKKLAFLVLTILFLSSTIVAVPVAHAQKAQKDSHGLYTADIDLLVASAIRRGLLPAGASNQQITNYVQAYFAQKMVKPYEYSNPRMAGRIAAREAGQDIGVDPSIDPVGTAKMVVLLVEFDPDYHDPGAPFDGPLHNQIPHPGPRDNTQFWIPDFDTAHYQSMLFSATPGARSMHNYYLEQSYGQFTVDGTVFGWVKIPHSEWFYGADDPAGGTDNLNGPDWRIVHDSLTAANAQLSIPWGDFDADDDGFVDHFAIVHAGADQAAGGGAQGDSAIWSHSGSAPPFEVQQDIYVSAYTIMPEDGNVGVFSHEFGHDIGLPDTYDTIYSGESSPSFWDLMASGSWLGDDITLDTRPSHISIWGKMALGWVSPALGNMMRYKLSDLKASKNVLMGQVETTGGIKAVRVDLPSQTVYMNTPYSGSYEWWSGTGVNLADYQLTRTVDLTGYPSATLTFWTQYEIETGWDFGFVQVSTDNGVTWTSLSDLEGRTTYSHDASAMAEIVANLPGFTGSSNGWVHETFNLPAGAPIMLRFRYMTDWGVTYMGWFLDQITVTADGTTIFYDGAETLDPGWTVYGWTIGTGTRTVGQYYIMEWRNFVGFDQALRYAYNWVDYAAGYAERFSYNPGLLVWYRNFAYTDNWVGVHPGYGFLLLVDSHPAPLKTPIGGYTFRTRIQVQDAPFSNQRTISNTLTYGKSRIYPSLQGSPAFYDKQSYYNPAKKPIWVQSSNYPYNLFRYPIPADSGTIVPSYGLKITVTSQDTANTWARINLVWKL